MARQHPHLDAVRDLQLLLHAPLLQVVPEKARVL
jgi:hypothetical protein